MSWFGGKQQSESKSLQGSASVPIETQVAQKVANVLDDHHIDPLVGLVLPGIGDIACGAVGLAVVGLAAWRKVSKVTLARMIVNLALSVGIGAIPLLGDAFDFWFRANSRNAALLAQAQQNRTETWRDYAVLVLAGLGLLVALAIPVAVIAFGVHYLVAHYGSGAAASVRTG